MDENEHIKKEIIRKHVNELEWIARYKTFFIFLIHSLKRNVAKTNYVLFYIDISIWFGIKLSHCIYAIDKSFVPPNGGYIHRAKKCAGVENWVHKQTHIMNFIQSMMSDIMFESLWLANRITPQHHESQRGPGSYTYCSWWFFSCCFVVIQQVWPHSGGVIDWYEYFVFFLFQSTVRTTRTLKHRHTHTQTTIGPKLTDSESTIS